MEAEGGHRPGAGRFTALLVAGLLGVVVGGGFTYFAMDRGKVTPTVLEGRAFPDGDTTAIGFRSDSEKADPGYSLAGATWFDGESWHDWSTDNCLTPLDDDQPIRLGVVEVEPTDEVAGRQIVVWFECL